MTVIITTHNRPKLLKRAINSILSQSLLPREILIIDDGSDLKPNLPEHKLIRYIYKQNGGISSARNLGIEQAKYEWISFLDDDDEWEKDKLKTQKAFHEQNPYIKASFTDERWIREEKELKVPKKYQKNTKNLFEKALKHCFIAPSSAMIHKSVFEQIGLFDESLKVCEDYDMWLRLLNEYEFGFINQKLIKKHAHDAEQLGFSQNLDQYRVNSLIKLLPSLSENRQAQAKKVLEEKLAILIRIAKKHDDAKNVHRYEDLLCKIIKF